MDTEFDVLMQEIHLLSEDVNNYMNVENGKKIILYACSCGIAKRRLFVKLCLMTLIWKLLEHNNPVQKTGFF